MGREIIKQDRTKSIGSTDCAGIMGLSPWSSPLKVWAEKTRAIEEEDISGKMPVKVGIKMENVVAELFMEETKKKVHRVKETIYHPKHKFLSANLDRRIVGEDALLEIKTASAFRKDEWNGEDIPPNYELQVHHQLLVSGKGKGYICVLVGNTDLIIKTIERDTRMLNTILLKEVEFWNKYVIPKIPPEIITKYDRDTLNKLYPQAEPETEIPLSIDADTMIDELGMFKQDAKHLEGLIEKHENKLKSLIKENERGVTPNNFVVRWFNSKWSGLDQKALKSEMPDIHARFFTSKPNRKFSYKKQTLK